MGATAESVKGSIPTTQRGLRLNTGEPFTPRVDMIDALARLAVGAFAVDRLLILVPPRRVDADPAESACDLDTLRSSWGALLGAVFLALTGLIMSWCCCGTPSRSRTCRRRSDSPRAQEFP
jgi:hypothetical protein